ncbi:MAG: peptidyl-tRNA hydrolase [Candidatus Poseidoniales archaeon]|nr:MAG: peptidyl-tRNA hydrolase [Candidatus Poseidoniales archaeon]
MSLMDDAPTMALIVRSDLAMSAGKTAVQCAHAAVKCAQLARKNNRIYDRWLEHGGRKICLTVDDESHLLEVMAQASAAGLVHAVVADAGHTEVPAGTVTVLGLGPATRRAMDAITGNLVAL